MNQFFETKLCTKCRGRGWCNFPCKIYYKIKEFMPKTIQINDLNTIKQEFFGASPPSVFIGSKLVYPVVNVGIMSVPEEKNAWIYDSPNYWSKENISSEQIIKFRQGLINSRFKSNVFEIRKNNKFLEIVKEIGMSSIQSDVEIKLAKKPKPKINFDSYLSPMGPSAQLKNIRIASNPKIPDSVEKVYSDTDLKSAEAMKFLYTKGLSEHSLMQLLSIGISGLKKNRKLVPTRNSITAIDDLIGKYLLTKIRDYKIINNPTFYFGGHLGNYYLILFFPEIFSYELFEIVFPKTTWNLLSKIEIMTDYESYKGRKNYAEETVGGYYAARLPILENLEKIKKQASVLVLRFVLPEYNVPLGVWVCRNSVRKSLSSQPIYFEAKEEMLRYTEEFVMNKFSFNVKNILNKSKFLKEVKEQTRLNKWV